MGKRKRPTKDKVPLWEIDTNVYIAPYDQLDQWPTWKREFPDIRIVFIRFWTALAAMAEMIEGKNREPFDNYCIVEPRSLENRQQFAIYSKVALEVRLGQVECLGAKICEKCFEIGKLYPETCPQHTSCAHRNFTEDCTHCLSLTFGGFWPERTQWWNTEFNNGKEPIDISLHTGVYYWVLCPTCLHHYETLTDTMLSNNNTNGCPYCRSLRLCPAYIDCKFCLENSFASSSTLSIKWHPTKNGTITPREVSLNAVAKHWVICTICEHDFKTSPLLIHSSAGNANCPYCSNQKRCQNLDCQFCLFHSLASISRAVTEWHPTQNGELTPRDVARNSAKKRVFLCPVCQHDYDKRPTHITRMDSWCPFCAGKKLCDVLECKICMPKSFAVHAMMIHWHPTKNGTVLPRHVFMNCTKVYWFLCFVCHHEFDGKPNDIVSSQQGCPFCSNHRRCKNEDLCEFCERNCQICLSRVARKQSRLTGLWYCNVCFDYFIKLDSRHKMIMPRAKISMEIFTLAELQSRSTNFLMLAPTSWDCGILPGQNFRPDCMWCFGPNDVLYENQGSCKLQTNEILYVLILEVIECSRAYHSIHRHISDANRELEIRNAFAPVRVGILFVTMSSKQDIHLGAHRNDVFFQKRYNSRVGVNEYEVLPERQDAWNQRIQEVQAKLTQMQQLKLNSTFTIGE